MKYLSKYFTFSLFIFLLISFSFSEDQIIPYNLPLKKFQILSFEGELFKSDGWPPNLRLIDKNNKIYGLDEKKDNSIPEILKEIINTNFYSIYGIFELEYLYSVDIPQYKDVIMCFGIKKINYLKVKQKYNDSYKILIDKNA